MFCSGLVFFINHSYVRIFVKKSNPKNEFFVIGYYIYSAKHKKYMIKRKEMISQLIQCWYYSRICHPERM